MGSHVGDLWSWWCHQMETFYVLLALCEGNSSVTGEFPHKGQWHGTLMFSLICAWTNGWANDQDTGDLICRRPHYDVTVMSTSIWLCHGETEASLGTSMDQEKELHNVKNIIFKHVFVIHETMNEGKKHLPTQVQIDQDWISQPASGLEHG